SLLAGQSAEGACKFVGVQRLAESVMVVRRLEGSGNDAVEGRGVAPGAIMVHHQVMRQLIQPRREGVAVPGIAPDGLPRLQKDLLAEVLGVLRVADLVVDVLVYLVYVAVVKLGKRHWISCRRALSKLRFVANHNI